MQTGFEISVQYISRMDILVEKSRVQYDKGGTHGSHFETA